MTPEEINFYRQSALDSDPRLLRELVGSARNGTIDRYKFIALTVYLLQDLGLKVEDFSERLPGTGSCPDLRVTFYDGRVIWLEIKIKGNLQQLHRMWIKSHPDEDVYLLRLEEFDEYFSSPTGFFDILKKDKIVIKSIAKR